ncbi:MAG: hypothetical protein H8D45_04805 [Bacteroidetes bacterium]|nr:hypothetical protein [Bacteroidota bacterium]
MVTYSRNAVFRFINEQSEIIGFVIPIFLLGIVWIYLFKNKLINHAKELSGEQKNER